MLWMGRLHRGTPHLLSSPVLEGITLEKSRTRTQAYTPIRLLLTSARSKVTSSILYQSVHIFLSPKRYSFCGYRVLRTPRGGRGWVWLRTIHNTNTGKDWFWFFVTFLPLFTRHLYPLDEFSEPRKVCEGKIPTSPTPLTMKRRLNLRLIDARVRFSLELNTFVRFSWWTTLMLRTSLSALMPGTTNLIEALDFSRATMHQQRIQIQVLFFL